MSKLRAVRVAATALLAVAAVFFMGKHQWLEAAFAAQLALDHDKCFTHLEDVVSGFDQQHAEAALAGDHGLAVGMSAESADFDLIAGIFILPTGSGPLYTNTPLRTPDFFSARYSAPN